MRQLSFPLEAIPEIQANPENYRLVSLLDVRVGPVSPEVGDERVLVIVDFETTGIEIENHHAIEMGLVVCQFSPSAGRITSVVDILSMLQQPPVPISEEITGITGITDEMVEGQKFDDETVRQLCALDALWVAWNSRFDRLFFDKSFPFAWAANACWACACYEVDWRKLGIAGNSLEGACYQAGRFYDAHRAEPDCKAAAHMLITVDGALANLLESARIQRYRVESEKILWRSKAEAKDRGYKYDFDAKVQYRIVSADEVKDEVLYLDSICEGKRLAVVLPDTCRTRFKLHSHRAETPRDRFFTDANVIASGVSKPPKPDLKEDALLAEVARLEKIVCSASGDLPEVWLYAEMARAKADTLKLYGANFPATFLGEGARETWTAQQLRNWIRHLERVAKENVRG